MRAILSSCWLLTVAFGNVIVIMVASVKETLPKQWMEFFLFAVLMFLDMLFFIFLASRYTYAEEKKEQVARSEHSE